MHIFWQGLKGLMSNTHSHRPSLKDSFFTVGLTSPHKASPLLLPKASERLDWEVQILKWHLSSFSITTIRWEVSCQISIFPVNLSLRRHNKYLKLHTGLLSKSCHNNFPGQDIYIFLRLLAIVMKDCAGQSIGK